VTGRSDRRDTRRRARTAEKIRRSAGPSDDAAVAFDEARKTIARDPDRERRENRWKRLTVLLAEFTAELRAGHRQ
jgi:hypothetical protein